MTQNPAGQTESGTAGVQAAIQVAQGFAERQRLQVAAIFRESFARKLAVLAKVPDRLERAIAEELDPQCAFVAVAGDRVLGVAGFYHDGSHLAPLRLRICLRHLGLWYGLIAYVIFALFQRALVPGDLVMDGIAVHREARGQGIGGKLLAAVAEFARAHGYAAVNLGVADTNPDAQRLYERSGFRVATTKHYPLANWLFGFSGVTYMRKPVQPGA